ncbi:MAG TPA: DUF5681 domain-containing protein [Thiopseudomonas sp.]|nr:DUF5681 domain-containing protein [Thiopseudomonas sp.]
MTTFKKGVSGNPAGRPKGSGLAGRLRKVIADDADEILQSVIDQAKAGDLAAAKILLDRIVPPLKPEAQAVQIDALSGSGDLVGKADAVIHAVGSGELAPDIAAQLISAVATLAKVIEVEQLQQRLEQLEKHLLQASKKP